MVCVWQRVVRYSTVLYSDLQITVTRNILFLLHFHFNASITTAVYCLFVHCAIVSQHAADLIVIVLDQAPQTAQV